LASFHLAMPAERKSFVNVDELIPQISLERMAAFYGVELDDLRRVGSETRTRCFLACGRTGGPATPALPARPDHPPRQWHCHQYGCGKSGNLVWMCDLLKPGPNAGGRPRGDRFKSIAADLLAMSVGTARNVDIPLAPPTQSPPTPEPPKVNLPLAQS